MIGIRIPSRFDNEKTFLHAYLSLDADGFTVDKIHSPLSKVNKNYLDEVNNEFNYSFVDEFGVHEIIGYKDRPLHNLLVLLARENILNKRIVTFDFNDNSVTSLINDDSFLNQLKLQPKKTISQIEKIISEDALECISLWLFYFYHTLSLDKEVTDFTELADTYLSSEIISKIIFSIDSKFFFNNLKKGSYITLRSKDVPDLYSLSYFSTKYASNDSHWRIKESYIAARKADKDGSIDQAMLKQLLDMANSKPSPIPSFLPEVKTPVSTALKIIKHFNSDLPDWEEVCNVLGVSLYRININSNILGLFLNNTEAHQPVIFVNTSIRNSGSHNFTIAHEIGHYLLHFTSYIVTCDEEDIYFPCKDDTKEIEANKFASELLMPTPLFRKFCKGEFNTISVENISNHFGVSKEAAARRRIGLDSKNKLAFVIVKNQKIISIIASIVNDSGMRWIGRPTVKNRAVSKQQALLLDEKNEVDLYDYLIDIDENNFNFYDLNINIYPFLNDDGNYLFIEKL